MNIDLLRKRLPAHVRDPDPGLYRSDNYVVFDFETTNHGNGLSIYPENSVVACGWRLGAGHPNFRGHGRVHDLYERSSEFAMDRLVADIALAGFVVAHNAKFDIGWLIRCGVDPASIVVWDTQIGEYVIGGNRWVFGQLSLEACARRRGWDGKASAVSLMIKNKVPPEEIPASWLHRYCLRDVELTERLFLDQRNTLAADDQLLAVQYTRCLLTPVLADIEQNGMQLDVAAVEERLDTLEREHARLTNELEEMASGVMLTSTAQLARFLYETLGFAEKIGRDRKPIRNKPTKQFPDGLPLTDADTIAGLTARTAKQERFLKTYLEMKEVHNELSKYIRKFGECCSTAGGVLRASFNQCNTHTHRLSSSGLDFSVQFQNFPRKFKPLFRSRDDANLIGEADGAQLEFRVAAHLGRDDVALDDIRNGTDIHSVTASVIGCDRQGAKEHTFKPLYGGRSGTPDERRYYEFFREKYRGIAEAQSRWVNTVLATKKLRTEWGLTYYWPNCKMERSGYITHTTNICNYPVQAFATAEIIPVALVYFWHYIRVAELTMMIVNTVHDSIIAELPPAEVEAFHSLSQHCLIDEVYAYLSSVYNVRLVVPLGAGVKVATRWGGKDADQYVPDGLEHKGGEVIYNAVEDHYV